jgi:hypothetical protein
LSLHKDNVAITVRLVLVIALVYGLSYQAAVAQPAQAARVGVVDFYTPSPLPPVSGIIPEERAADDLTDLLAGSAGQQVAVLSRVAVREAESAIGWQGVDVLRFDRLQRLARMVGADRLLVGWIQRLVLDRSGTERQGGGHFFSGFATVVVQVFDAEQGRLVSQVQQSAYEPSAIGPVVTERLLRRVLERAIPSVLPSLVGGSR